MIKTNNIKLYIFELQVGIIELFLINIIILIIYLYFFSLYTCL